MKVYKDYLEHTIDTLRFGESPKNLYDPLKYIMSLGGKRMRPVATLLSYHLYKEDWKSIVKPALAVEVFHNFSLIHDDIMDEAPLRRGQATVHQKWDTNTAILSGDVMLIAAYNLLGEVPSQYFKKAFYRFNKMAAEVCEGQQLDVDFEKRDDIVASEYLGMIQLKTSVLVAFAMELGGILAGVDEKEQAILYDVGLNYGLGFQVKDDILDVFGEQAKVGKQVGGDIIENKKTWLYIEAMKRSEGTLLGEKLRKWIDTNDTNRKEEKVEKVRSIYYELGIKKEAEKLMESYFKKGFEKVEELSCAQDNKKSLTDLGEYLLKRES